jgi:copper(I)-binding protein
MRDMILRAALLSAAVLALASPAGAHEYRVGNLTIGHPWTRAIGSSAPTAAGYLSLANKGTETDRLVSAETPMASRVEMHEMSMTDGIMRMRPLQGGIPVPPGGTVWLRPGGLHLMLVGPEGAFVQGNRVPLTLHFERAGEVTVELEVAAAGARNPGQGGH